MRRWKKWAAVFGLVAFLYIFPVTRGIIQFLLPLGTGVDDLIVWMAILGFLFFSFGGPLWVAISAQGGKLMRYLSRFRFMFILILLIPLFTTGCYFRTGVSQYEIGLRMSDGVKIDEIVGPGRYTDISPWSDLKRIDASAKTFEWSDPDLVTKDKQPIGLTLGLSYARDRATDTILKMWNEYRVEAENDEALELIVRNRVPRVAKAITAQFTLDQMLGVAEGTTGTDQAGRELVSQRIFKLLEPELSEIGIILLDVGVNDISPDSSYLKLLTDKAKAQVEVEVARERTRQLAEQLKQEEAQTSIDVEKARRQNLVNKELAKTYELSDRYYELERLKLMRGIIGVNDKFVITPQGADLTLLFGGMGGNVVPVGSKPEEQ